jgi:LPXTG-motif cell wall-anchored protein
MKKKLIAGLVAASALIAAPVTPAFADATYVVDGTNWQINDTDDFGIEQFSEFENTAPHGAYSGDSFKLILDNPSNPGSDLSFNCAGVTPTVQSLGDLLVDCDSPSELLGGDLTWDANITIFSGDYRGLVARTVYTLTNTTGTDLNLDLRFVMDTEECQSGGNIATSSGNFDTDTGDVWLSCRNDNDAVETLAWGNNWLDSFETDDSLNACDVCIFKNDDLAISAGDTLTFAFFVYSEGSTNAGNPFGDTNDNIIANATGYFDLDTIGSSRLWKGLTTTMNWAMVFGTYQEPAEASGPSLPDTGVNAAGLLFAAFALLGLGAVIVVRRRSARA